MIPHFYEFQQLLPMYVVLEEVENDLVLLNLYRVMYALVILLDFLNLLYAIHMLDLEQNSLVVDLQNNHHNHDKYHLLPPLHPILLTIHFTLPSNYIY